MRIHVRAMDVLRGLGGEHDYQYLLIDIDNGGMTRPMTVLLEPQLLELQYQIEDALQRVRFAKGDTNAKG